MKLALALIVCLAVVAVAQTATIPSTCRTVRPFTQVVTTAAAFVPQRADAGSFVMGSRAYVKICSSNRNSGSPIVNCNSADAGSVGVLITEPAEEIAIGQCIYVMTNGQSSTRGDIKCASDQDAGVTIKGYECSVFGNAN